MISVPASGTGSTTLRVAVTANEGSAIRTATIRAGGVSVVLEQPVRMPWRPLPDAISFTYQPGRGNPAPKSLGLWIGQGSLNYTVETAGGSWFSVKGGNGLSKMPEALTVTVNPGGLSPGVYRGQITIKAAEGNPTEQAVPVTLTVSPLLYTLETAVGMPEPTGSAPATSWPLPYITSVAADPSGNLYIVDQSRGLILKLTPDGTLSEFYRDYSGRSPISVACGAKGEVYFTYPLGYGIAKLTGPGQYPVTLPSTYTVGSVNLIGDGKGNLYFSDAGSRVYKIASDGPPQVIAGGGTTYSPADGTPATSVYLGSISSNGLGVDGEGNVYINSSRLYKVSPSGSITTVTKFFGVDQYNSQIAVAADGTVYGTGENFDPLPGPNATSIVKMPPGDAVVSFAGSSTAGYSGDGGPALEARFNRISDMAVDLNGNLIIADAGNGLIRRVTADGVVNTIAGVLHTTTGPGSRTILTQVTDLAAGPKGDLWFIDSGDILRLGPDGVVRPFAQRISDGWPEPWTSVSVSPEGAVFATEYNSRVYRLDTPGPVHVAGGGSTSPADGLTGTSARFGLGAKVVAAKNGVVYVAEPSRKLWRLPGDGTIRLVSGPTLGPQVNLAADSSGQVYISSGSKYWKVSPDGVAQALDIKASGTYGSVTTGPLDQFYYSVKDGLNIVTPDGRTVAVNSASLVGADKSLFEPYSMAADNDGRVYLNRAMQRIQVLVPADGTCLATAMPARLDIPAEGGTATVQIQAPDRCGWAVEGSTSWIALTSSASGTGNGSIVMRVAPDASPGARAFTFTINGSPVTVAQTGQVAVPFTAPGFEAIGAASLPLTAPDAVLFLNSKGGMAMADIIANRPSTSTDLGGTTVEINGKPAVLDYVAPDYIVCFVPRDTPAGTVSVVVKLFGTPVASGSIRVAPVAPGILLVGEEELGEIDGYNSVTGAAAPFAVETPANAGSDKRTRVTFRATGIRYADGRAPDGQQVDVSRFLRIEAVDAEGRPLTLPVESTALDKSFAGVDLVTVILPPEANRSSKVIIRLFVGDSGSNPAAIKIRQTTLQITSVNVAGGASGITQNAWIEIKGTALAPAAVGPYGQAWNSAPEFAVGRMPTELLGVSVKVNGKSAYVYWISTTQINVLTPLDDARGDVQIQVTNATATSPSFTVSKKTVAPAFLLLGATGHIVAQHGSGALLGPSSMSVPGYTFTPAKPGETVVFFGTGFGLPSTPLVDGSAIQSGSLPRPPVIQIGGADATVVFAGVVSPGLYQLNVTVPSTVPDGDLPVTCVYDGAPTPAGSLVSVRR